MRKQIEIEHWKGVSRHYFHTARIPNTSPRTRVQHFISKCHFFPSIWELDTLPTLSQHAQETLGTCVLKVSESVHPQNIGKKSEHFEIKCEHVRHWHVASGKESVL